LTRAVIGVIRAAVLEDRPTMDSAAFEEAVVRLRCGC
jgi:hypothetical protein